MVEIMSRKNKSKLEKTNKDVVIDRKKLINILMKAISK